MALVVRYDALQSVAAPARKLPRPGRRAASLVIGLALMFLLIDAIVHPHTVAGLWTMQTIRRLEAPGLLPLFTAVESSIGSAAAFLAWPAVAALGLASLAFVVRGRSIRRRADGGREETGERRSYLDVARDQFLRPAGDDRVRPRSLPAPLQFPAHCRHRRQVA
jgi:hypothetical protein